MSEGSGFRVIHRDCASFNRALWKSWHILHLVKVYVVRRSALSRIMMDFFLFWHVDLPLFIKLNPTLLCINQYGRFNAWSLLHDLLCACVLARIDVVLNAVFLRRQSAANIWSESTSSFGPFVSGAIYIKIYLCVCSSNFFTSFSVSIRRLARRLPLSSTMGDFGKSEEYETQVLTRTNRSNVWKRVKASCTKRWKKRNEEAS